MIKLIDKPNGQVTDFDDAITRYFIKGNDKDNSTVGGVYKDVYNQFSVQLDTTNQKIIINSGVAEIYGRRVKIPNGDFVEIDLSTLVGIKYGIIYIKIDTRDISNEKVSIDYEVNSLSYPTITPGDNLIKSELGVARMRLYTFYYDSSRGYGYTSDLRYFLDPQTVEYCKIAYSLPGSSTINGRTVSTIVNSDRDTVKRADLSTSTDAIKGNPIDSILRLTSKNKITIPIIKTIWDSNITVNFGREIPEKKYGLTTVNINDIEVILIVVEFVGSLNHGTWSGTFVETKGYTEVSGKVFYKGDSYRALSSVGYQNVKMGIEVQYSNENLVASYVSEQVNSCSFDKVRISIFGYLK